MSGEIPNNETRTRILDVADELFSKRGFSSVTLRDIAAAVGMKHASLYYYAPGGKEGLFIEVMERNFRRHHQGMTEAIAGAGDDLRAQMRAVAEWLVSQPPMDLSRMYQSDMPAISEKHPHEAERLLDLAYDSLRIPIASALERASAAGEVEVADVDMAALSMVSLMQSIHVIPGADTEELQRVGRNLADMLLDGWRKR